MAKRNRKPDKPWKKRKNGVLADGEAQRVAVAVEFDAQQLLRAARGEPLHPEPPRAAPVHADLPRQRL